MSRELIFPFKLNVTPFSRALVPFYSDVVGIRHVSFNQIPPIGGVFAAFLGATMNGHGSCLYYVFRPLTAFVIETNVMKIYILFKLSNVLNGIPFLLSRGCISGAT